MSNNLPAWLVLLVAMVGGGGVAAMGSVVVAYLRNRQVAETEERSVTIVEVEKAIPGLGEIIRQLREQNNSQADEIVRINARNQQLVGEVFNLERRVTELEQELTEAKGHR